MDLNILQNRTSVVKDNRGHSFQVGHGSLQEIHPSSVSFARKRKVTPSVYPHSSSKGCTLTLEMFDHGTNSHVFGIAGPMRHNSAVMENRHLANR